METHGAREERNGKTGMQSKWADVTNTAGVVSTGNGR